MTVDNDFEYPNCPLCQSEQREDKYVKFGLHKIVRCCLCQAYYLYPRLTEDAMRRVYLQDDYFEGGQTGYSDISYAFQEKALRATFRRLMRSLEKRGLTGGSLLEIGCGYGFLLEEAKEFYSLRVGTEFSSRGAQIASTKADKIFEGGLEMLPLDLKFDCVIATHVIEHVYDPLEFIKSLINHTNRHGKIVLAAPDMNGLLRKFLGHRWPSFKIPEHVTYFDSTTLSAVMRQAGLKNLNLLPYPHAFPLALIASKLHLALPALLGNIKVWVPATTVAISGTVSHD